MTSCMGRWNVVVDDVVHGQVALGDGVGAAGLVLVDQLVHVRSKHVLAVLVDVLLVNRVPEDGRAARCTAADANAREQLKSRDDGHREAPTAYGLPAKPCAEEASARGVHKRDDAADAGQALDASEAGASDSACGPCCLRSFGVALRRPGSSGSTPCSASPRATARNDPVEYDDAA